MMTLALTDLLKGLVQWRIWLHLGWVSLRVLYARSFVGSLWIIISFSLLIFVKIFIMSQLFASRTEMNFNYPMYIAIGFLIFFYINSSIMNGTVVFVNSANYIHNGNNPISAYIYKDIFRETYSLLLNSIVICTMMLTLKIPVGTACISLILGFIILLVNGTWVKIVLGVYGAQYRDIQHLFAAIMRIMLFMSPVLWTKDQIGGAIQILYWNPIYHYIEIIRAPILEGNVPVQSWNFVAAFTILGWLIAIFLYSKNIRNIPHWV